MSMLESLKPVLVDKDESLESDPGDA
jgi:hypothetical protein